jgi:hypothetical protein
MNINDNIYGYFLHIPENPKIGVIGVLTKESLYPNLPNPASTL